MLFFSISFATATDNLTDLSISSSENLDAQDENTILTIDDESNNDYINSGEDNTVDFSSDVTNGTGSLQVQFYGTSTKEDIGAWSWDFGDGNTSDEQNPIHTYGIFGSYNVTLKTTDSNGIQDNITKPYYIDVFLDSGSVFENPAFEEGNNKDVPGWIIEQHAKGSAYISTTCVDISTYKFIKSLTIPTALRASSEGSDTQYSKTDVGFGQYLNFDVLDSISFSAARMAKDMPAPYGTGVSTEIATTIIVTIGEKKYQYELDTCMYEWKSFTIDTSDISGTQLFRVYIYMNNDQITFFKWFDGTYNGLNFANFTYSINNIENDNLNLTFNGNYGGLITNVLWDFGDGNTSTEINPTKTVKVGSTVTLTVYNANKTSSTCSMVIGNELPKIGDKFYASIQDAINDAEEGAIIDLNSNLVGDLQVNKSLTINFNGNAIIGSGSPVIQVLDGAKVTIKNITFEDSNVISTDNESSLTITESNITNADIILYTGNIAIDGSKFNNSFITIANANAVISNNNIANGGIKVNGGKSKINNNVLSGNDVAITQNEGETNITSNIITDNNIGVNVTNGTSNINFNVIYNNNIVSIAYVGSVDATNNWFGVIQPTFTTISSDEYVDVYAPEAESQPAWLVLILNSNETTLSSAQNYTISVDLTHNSKGDDTSSLGVLPKFSLPVSTKLGQASAVNIENSIGEFTLTTATLTSDDATFTINGEEYTLDVNIFKIEDRINELETQLADAQDNATKLANKLEDANKKVENLTNQLNETQANATKLAEDLADANQKADNLTTQLSEAQKTIQNLSDPISTTIAANTLTIKALDSGNIQVTLKDANNNLLSNKDVQVIINGVVYNGKTGDNGVAKIAVKFASAGTYYATVSFAGDNAYKSSIGTSKVVVSKKATKITAPKKTFKAKVKTKKVTITLKSGSTVLKSKKITLKVNGKTYTAKTNSKGVATIKVTKLTKKGTFTYTVKFAGDKAYKAITKKGKMTIK